MKWWWLLWGALGSVGSAFADLAPMKTIPIFYDENTSLTFDLQGPTRPTFQKFDTIQKGKTFQGVNALLKKLKISPDFEILFQNFTLVYQSKSLFRKDVSKKYPRIIAHGPGFFIGLTGDPEKNSFESIELAEFDVAANQFKPRLLKHNRTTQEFDDVPPKDLSCTGCHTKNFQPLWSSYALWNGAVGSRDDKPTASETKVFSDLLDNLEKPEFARYRIFLEKMESVEDFSKRSPNFGLSKHISALKYRQLVQSLQNEKVLQPYLFALGGALLNCPDIESFLPAKVKLAHDQKLVESIPELTTRFQAVLQLDKETREKRFIELVGNDELMFGNDFDLAHVEPLAKLYYLIDGQPISSQVSLKLSGLTAEPRATLALAHSNGGKGLNDLYDRELFELLVAEGMKYGASCEDLAAESKKRLEN